MKKYIAAKTRQDVINYCVKNNFNIHSFKHIYRPEQVKGLSSVSIIMLNSGRLPQDLKAEIYSRHDIELQFEDI